MAANAHGRPFELSLKRLGQKWISIYNRHVLRRADLAESSVEDMFAKVEKSWNEFLEQDLPVIDEFVNKLFMPGTQD